MCARPLKDRVAEKEAQLQKTIDKAERCKAQLKRLKSRQENEERKARTHKLIVCGAELAALFGHVLSREEVSALVDFLRIQRDRGILTISDSGVAVSQEQRNRNKDDNLDDMFNSFFGIDCAEG